MAKYVIVDCRLIEESLKATRSYLETQSIYSVKNLLPILLSEVDDCRENSSIWDFLGVTMSNQKFEALDYENLTFAFENITAFIQEELNERFNLPNDTTYYFEDWVGDDVRLGISND